MCHQRPQKDCFSVQDPLTYITQRISRMPAHLQHLQHNAHCDWIDFMGSSSSCVSLYPKHNLKTIRTQNIKKWWARAQVYSFQACPAQSSISTACCGCTLCLVALKLWSPRAVAERVFWVHKFWPFPFFFLIVQSKTNWWTFCVSVCVGGGKLTVAWKQWRWRRNHCLLFLIRNRRPGGEIPSGVLLRRCSKKTQSSTVQHSP